LHLSADTKHEAAANYAVSVADAFGAHLTAITFAHEPVSLVTLMGGVPPADFINAQRALAEEAANAAMTKLSEAARRSKYPPAKPGALCCEPLKAAIGGADATPVDVSRLKAARGGR